MAVKKFYLNYKDTNQYCHADLIHIVQDHQITSMHSLDDLGEYHQAFLCISTCLIANRCLSEAKHDTLFLSGFLDLVYDHLQHQLTIVKPDVHPDDPYTMEDILDAVKFLLSGSMFHRPPISYNMPSLSYNEPIHSSVFLISSCKPANTFRLPNIPAGINPDSDPLDACDIRDIESDVFDSDSDDKSSSSSETTADPDFRIHISRGSLAHVPGRQGCCCRSCGFWLGSIDCYFFIQ